MTDKDYIIKELEMLVETLEVVETEERKKEDKYMEHYKETDKLSYYAMSINSLSAANAYRSAKILIENVIVRSKISIREEL